MTKAGATGYRGDGLASVDNRDRRIQPIGREGLRLLPRCERNGAILSSRRDGRTGQLTGAVLNVLTRFLEARPRSRVAHVAIAASAVGVAYALTVLVRAWTPHTVFMLFIPAVMISAWYGQLLGGATATVLSIVLVGPFVLPSSLVDEIEFFVVATLVAMTTSTLVSALRRVDDRRRSDLSRERRHRMDAEAVALIEQRRRTDAELHSRAKTDFLALLGHELRQPLNAILSAAAVVEKAPDSRTRERATTTIERQATHMTRLVEDLLDLSRIHRGVVELRKDIVDGGELFREITEAARPLMTQHRHRFTVSMPSSVPLVRADPARLRQIVSNLLTNAAKYTPAGGEITLTIETHDGTLRLRVRDTGRGIPPDLLPAVFDLYRRSNPEAGGMGVGLAVVKALTEAHGGTVEAFSPGSGRGAEFIVTLPGAVCTQAV